MRRRGTEFTFQPQLSVDPPMGLKATHRHQAYLDIPQEWSTQHPLSIYGKMRVMGLMWLLIQNTTGQTAYKQDKLIPVLKVLGVQGQGSRRSHFWQTSISDSWMIFCFIQDEGGQGRPVEPHLIHRGSHSPLAHRLHKVLFPNAITLVMRFQHVNFGCTLVQTIGKSISGLCQEVIAEQRSLFSKASAILMF